MGSIKSATLAFVDTPSNDFASLASNIDKSMPALSQDGKRPIYPLMVPKSHFEQVLSDDVVDAGFSFTALHWLRTMPPKDHKITNMAALSASAHGDLVAFLSARYNELRKGGTLTLCMPANGEPNVAKMVGCLHETIDAVSDKYPINHTAIDRMPVYYRTMGEIETAVKQAQGEWRILGQAMVPMPHPACPATLPAIEAGTIGAEDLDRYATKLTGFGMAAVSFLLTDDVKPTMGVKYPGDAKFLADFQAKFKEVFLHSYLKESYGFMYAFIRLQKI